DANVTVWLAARELLLVLDNFEHLLDAAPLVIELLAAAPRMQILATSRVPLGVSAEYVHHVEPMPVAEAAHLFVERAAAAGVEVEHSDDVEKICRRLDCLPLAIELAAARSRTLAPPQLVERLSRRLRTLGHGPRDAPERQRTLRATIEWSYELLDYDERSVLARLATFADGCTLEAAEQVCGARLELLESLVDKNLLRQEGGRFWMLETIREYAAEQLDASGDRDEIDPRLAEYMIELAEVNVLRLRGTGAFTPEAGILTRELANIRAVLRSALDRGDIETVVELGSILRPFWMHSGGQAEGLEWLEAALGQSQLTVAPGHAQALSAAGV